MKDNKMTLTVNFFKFDHNQLKPFLASAPILKPPITPENLCFSGLFGGEGG